jgi:hypothetical protein
VREVSHVEELCSMSLRVGAGLGFSLIAGLDVSGFVLSLRVCFDRLST